MAADHVIEALVAAGVDTFFGVPDGPVMPVFDAVLRHRGARLIESRHETTALFSAMGYWTVTGRGPASWSPRSGRDQPRSRSCAASSRPAGG